VPRRPKPLPEKLYGSTVSWEGWTFRVLSSTQGLRWISLAAAPSEQLAERLHARILPDDRANDEALRELHAYLRGERRAFSVPLDLRGTSFQHRVWESLQEIPYGCTTTYGAIAAGIERPRATRAVGQALRSNPVPIVIPCHRVIGKNGHLVGFGGGLPLKERLLALESGSLDL